MWPVFPDSCSGEQLYVGQSRSEVGAGGSKALAASATGGVSRGLGWLAEQAPSDRHLLDDLQAVAVEADHVAGGGAGEQADLAQAEGD